MNIRFGSTDRQIDVSGVDGVGQDDAESHQPGAGRHDEGRDPGAGRVLQEAEAVEGHQQVGQHGDVHRDILQHTKTSLLYFPCRSESCPSYDAAAAMGLLLNPRRLSSQDRQKWGGNDKCPE